MNDRLSRLRSTLPDLGAAAILVAQPTNVLYLTGFSSSNAVVLLDDTARLFTDGRYIEAARAVDGVDVVHAERDLFGDLAKRLPELVEGPIAFEAEHLSVAQHTKLAGGGATLVPAKQSVERLRAVKDPDELEAVRRSARLLNEAFELLGREQVSGRDRGRARLVDGANDPRARSRGGVVLADRGERAARSAAAPSSRRPGHRGGRCSAGRCGRCRRRLLLRLHADVRRRRGGARPPGAPTRFASRRSCARSTRSLPARRRRPWTQSRAGSSASTGTT